MPRWIKIVIAIVMSLAVIAGVAEWGLRLAIPRIVQNELRTQLDLPSTQPVTVRLGGSTVLHALRGGIGDIEVEIVDAPVADGVRATLGFHADRVPFSVMSGEISGGTASIFVPSAELDPVVSLLTDGAADSGKTKSGTIVVGRTLDVFGFTVPLEASLGLSAENGNVRVVPAGLSAVGFDLSAEQIASATGGLLDPLLSPHVICIDDRLPAGVKLEAIKIALGGVRVNVTLAPDFLSNPAQLQPGTCE